MQEATSYFVPKRGIYVTSALIDSADQSFPYLLLRFIPEKARMEWRAAGRCLAFSLLSASGFHVARAVEAVLDVYIKTFSPTVDTSKFSWGDFLKELEGAKSSDAGICPSEKVISELRQLKDDYRNPLMHPRVVLSEADARVLFDNGESLIILMAEHLRSMNETSAARLLLG
jgi:hypothetical protein